MLDDPEALPDRSSATLSEIENGVTLGDILRALPDPVVIKKKSGERWIDRSIQLNTAFDPAEPPMVDPRTQTPLTSDADDEASAVRAGSDYSPKFRRDQEYDDKLRRAGAPVNEETDDRISDSRVLVVKTTDVDEFITKLTDAQTNSYEAPPPWLWKFFDNEVERRLGNVRIEALGAPDNVTAGTISDWRIDELEGDAFIIRHRTNGDLAVPGPSVEVYFAGSVGLPSGVLLMEALAMLSDSKAEDLPPPGELATYARRKFPLATAMRIVLCFELPAGLAEGEDPVPRLIKLTNSDGSGVEHTLGGQSRVVLQSVINDLAGRPNYNIVVREEFQDAEQVAIPFTVEMQAQRNHNGKRFTSSSTTELKEVYKIVVTRRVLGRPDISEVTVEYNPYVIEKMEDGEIVAIIQPQFQHIDDGPELRIPVGDDNQAIDPSAENERTVHENDWLEYTIVVRSVDRVLVETIFPVQRRVPKILPPPTHAQVVQRVDRSDLSTTISYEFIVGIVNVPLDGKKQERRKQEERDFEPRLLYRWIPIAVDGFYGIDQAPGLRTRWKEGLPDLTISQGPHGSPAPRQIRFAGAEMLDSVRWETLSDLGEALPIEFQWASIKYQVGKGDEIEGALAIRLTEQDLKPLWSSQPSRDLGVEFFVGFEKTTPSPGHSQPPRSNLVRMRHAGFGPFLSRESKTLIERTGPVPEDQVGKMFRQGNEVAAVELLPSVISLSDRFVPKQHIPEMHPQWRSIDQAWQNEPLVLPKESETAARLRVLWNHVPSLLANDADGASQEVFNPVVGYRLHRIDRYLSTDFEEYAAVEGMPRRPERFVKTLPLDKFRDTPTSIVVHGNGNWQRLEQWPTEFKSEPIGPEPIGWEAIADSSSDLVFVEANPVYLCKSLVELARAIREFADTKAGIMDIKLVVRCHTPLPVASVHAAVEAGRRPEKTERETDEEFKKRLEEYEVHLRDILSKEAADRFDRLRQSLTNEIDPFGWLTAESLGLSCECRLLDSDDNPISLHALLGTQNLSDFLKEIHGQVKDLLPHTLITFFVGQDEQTVLNTFRLVYTDLAELWDVTRDQDGTIVTAEPKSTLKRSLRVNLIGEVPHDEDDRLPKFDVDSEIDSLTSKVIDTIQGKFGEGLTEWATAAFSRLQGSPGVAAASKGGLVLGLVDRGSVAGGQNDSALVQAISAVLPISALGQVETTLPIPDQWAHDYHIAIEYLQRYDWMLRDPQRDEDQLQQNIPDEYVRSTDPTPRTHALVAHNLLAMPLPGGIQAYVFRHPADYAAQASADMKNAGQYSGQTTLLQYRIPPTVALDLFTPVARESASPVTEEQVLSELKRWLESNQLDGTNAVDWLSYRRWLELSGHEVSAGHDSNPDTEWRIDLIPGPKQPTVTHCQMLEPIREAIGGVYGADRYVHPDVLGYYQFRALAYSTAGAVCSPILLVR